MHPQASSPRRPAAAALLAAIAALTLGAPEARADEGLIWVNTAFGIGGADFKGYPEFEYGFGLSLDGGLALVYDDIAFAAGLNTTWMRTSDASPTGGRVVTTGTFYGATVGAGLGSREGALLLRVGGGFAERDVDDLPDGEFNAVTRSSGFATLIGICGILGDEGAGLTAGVDYIIQPGDEGMSFINVYIGFGVLIGE